MARARFIITHIVGDQGEHGATNSVAKIRVLLAKFDTISSFTKKPKKQEKQETEHL